MDLVCSICLYTKEGEANAAITVMGGEAVCDDHLGYAQSPTVTFAIQQEKREGS